MHTAYGLLQFYLLKKGHQKQSQQSCQSTFNMILEIKKPSRIRSFPKISNKMKSSNIFQVEKILNKRAKNNLIEYQVKWKGYPLKEATWEPLKNLAGALDEVNNYEAKNYKDAKEKRRRSRSKEKTRTFDSEESSQTDNEAREEKENGESSSQSNNQEVLVRGEKYVKILDWKKDQKTKKVKVQVQQRGRGKKACWVDEKEVQKGAPTLLCNFFLKHLKIK